MKVREALRLAMKDSILEKKDTYIVGEDIAVYGGCCQVTGDLYKEFPLNIIQTPISEEGIANMSIGMAMTGLRVFCEIMYSDFLSLAADPIINHAAKIRFLSANELKLPIVFRTPTGSGFHAGAQHSQNPEAWFSNIPGLNIVIPSDASSAYHLLRASIKSNNPVLFLEPRSIYDDDGEIQEKLTLGKARVLSEGKKFTLITYGAMTKVALNVAKKLKGIQVIDLLSLRPLDFNLIKKSILITKNVGFLSEAPGFGNYMNEVVKQVVCDKDLFKILENEPLIMCSSEAPNPFSKPLEGAFKYNEEKVLEKLKNYIKE